MDTKDIIKYYERVLSDKTKTLPPETKERAELILKNLKSIQKLSDYLISQIDESANKRTTTNNGFDMEYYRGKNNAFLKYGSLSRMENKRLGNAFEREFAKILYQNGWWVHNAVQSKAGQPADIIACKGVVSMLIDCKLCANDTFSLSRIEPNQHSAMLLWKQRVNRLTFFALKLSDGSIHMASLDELLKCDKKILSKQDIKRFDNIDCWLLGVNS